MTWRDGWDWENLWKGTRRMRHDRVAAVFCQEMERRDDQTFCVSMVFGAVGNLMWGCRFCSAGERGGLRQAQAERNSSDEILR